MEFGLGLSLPNIAVISGGSSDALETVNASGGTVKDGEQFTLNYASGGLTGATGVTIDGVACTGVSVTDDNNMTATAPADDLLHNIGGTAFDLVISF